MEPLAKPQKTVTPVKTGVQNYLNSLDSGFRRNDTKGLLQEALCRFNFALFALQESFDIILVFYEDQNAYNQRKIHIFHRFF